MIPVAHRKKTLVVGAGAGGMTLALLLAKTGRPVLLVDSQPEIGGYLRRFRRKGAFFDTGYHFTGGFSGVMTQMMQILGMDDMVGGTPIPHRIVLRDGAHDIFLPAGCGHAGTEDIFCRAFPGSADALHKLFEQERQIWQSTPMADLRDLSPLELTISGSDIQTVEEVWRNELNLTDPAAMTAAGSFAMCHGTPFNEAPMSFHARVSYALHHDLARPHRGGDSMIDGFKREAAKLDIEIRTSAELLPFKDENTAYFSDGSSVPVEQVFFTVHPSAIASLLPENARTPSFLRRVRRMQESCSFFCAYFLVDDGVEIPAGLTSYFTANDVDSILLDGRNSSSTGIQISREDGKTSISAFRTMRLEHLPEGFRISHRERLKQEEYQNFKTHLCDEIQQEITGIYPQLKDHLTVVESGSPLTCLDYDPPTGSAYGTRSICGQARLFGKLPAENFFAAGQSALVPGVMGTCLASFSVFRQAAGETVWRDLIRKTLY